LVVCDKGGEYSTPESGPAVCGPDLTGQWLTHNYYHADGNGNITALESSLETLSASYRYDSFGNTLSQSGGLADANVYRFSSKEIHALSGLYYFGLRWYAPGVQRWLNRDPIGELGGLNLYCYVENNPLFRNDPFGLSNRDVLNIIKAAQNSIDSMTKKGQRINDGILGGNLNNWTAFLLSWVPNKDDDYKLKGCGEQSQAVLFDLLKQSYDDSWIMTQTYVNTLPFGIPHQYLILHSTNPTDPTIVIDPQKNKVRIDNFPTMNFQIPHAPDVYTKPAGNNGFSVQLEVQPSP